MVKPFNATLIPKCHDRLTKSKQALHGCKNARSFEEFASHWAAFLIHTGGVLNALDAGSKGTPQGRQWYGGIKRFGKNDPLVSYMHQARNVEEHAAEPTSENRTGNITIGGGGEPVVISELLTGPEFFRDPRAYLKGRAWNPLTGEMPSIVHNVGGPALRPVVDHRNNAEFKPPKHHDGKPLKDETPIGVAAVYIDYLERTVSAAASLA